MLSGRPFTSKASSESDHLPALKGVSSVHSFCHVQLFATPWTAAHQASLSITISWSLLKLMSIESMMNPTISSSVVPFFSCLQSFPASGSFPRSQFFTSGGQSIGVSASTSVLPLNIQDWFPLGMDWLDLLAVQGTLKSLIQHHNSKHQFFSFLYSPTLTSICDYWKNHSFD